MMEDFDSAIAAIGGTIATSTDCTTTRLGPGLVLTGSHCHWALNIKPSVLTHQRESLVQLRRAAIDEVQNNLRIFVRKCKTLFTFRNNYCYCSLE